MSKSDELEARLAKLRDTAYTAAYDAQSDFLEWARDAITALLAAEEELARVRKDALSLRRLLIDWRQREWPHTNQAEIIDRDYPSIAAMKERPNV